MKKVATGFILISLVFGALPALAQEGAIVGAIIGAAVGNQVGNGSGRDAATAVGAFVGAVVGDKVERERERERRDGTAPNPPRYDERRDPVPPRHRDDRDRNPPRYGGDRRDPAPPPRYDRGNPRRPNPPPPVRPNPPPYPNPPRNPPPPPGSGFYNDTAFVPSITRRIGGEWIRVTLDRPVTIDTLFVQPEFHGLQIYEAYVYNQYGQRLEIRSYYGLPTIYPGQYAYSERLHYMGRIQAIEIRMESMGGFANAFIRIESPEGPSYPRANR